MSVYQGYAHAHELERMNGPVTDYRRGLKPLEYKGAKGVAIHAARLTPETAEGFVAKYVNSPGCVTCFPGAIVGRLNKGDTVMVFHRDLKNCNPTSDGKTVFIMKVFSPKQATKNLLVCGRA